MTCLKCLKGKSGGSPDLVHKCYALLVCERKDVRLPHGKPDHISVLQIGKLGQYLSIHMGFIMKDRYIRFPGVPHKLVCLPDSGTVVPGAALVAEVVLTSVEYGGASHGSNPK
jgi:hypothetical protein